MGKAGPAVVGGQCRDDHLQRDTVQWVARLGWQGCGVIHPALSQWRPGIEPQRAGSGKQSATTSRKHACNFIVMASHGRHGVAALLWGSETPKVLGHCAVPVLVVH